MNRSWFEIPDDTGFDLTNLPYGVISRGDEPRQIAVPFGNHAMLLGAAAEEGLFDGLPGDAADLLLADTLNPFMAAGPRAWQAVRERILDLLESRTRANAVRPLMTRLDIEADPVRHHLPFAVADYAEFCASRDHAENIGRILRPNGGPLPPNWTHLPIGRHGKAGSVVVSGTPITRPRGQRVCAPGADPDYGPTIRLDIEAEVGFVAGPPTEPGRTVGVDEFTEHIFGVVLVNGWTARDIQSWEDSPLGPFLGKSFATSISPWVVPLEALAEARVAPPVQSPAPLPHLLGDHWGYDVRMLVELNGTAVSEPSVAGLYWTPAQHLAHITSNGAPLRTGDLLASGAVSGPKPAQRGSLVELTSNGTMPLLLADGTTRTFLADGDTVDIRASAPGAEGTAIGFGTVSGTIQSR